MQLDTGTPIYRQILQDICRKAACGELLPGQKLPSVRALADLYQINPNTAARIYRELEGAGLAFTRSGLGTYLSRDAGRIKKLRKEMAGEALSLFIRNMKALGYEDTGIKSLVNQALCSGEDMSGSY